MSSPLSPKPSCLTSFLVYRKKKKRKTLHLEWLINIRPGGKNRLRNRVHSAPPDLVLNGIMACSHFEMHSLPEAQGEVFIKDELLCWSRSLASISMSGVIPAGAKTLWRGSMYLCRKAKRRTIQLPTFSLSCLFFHGTI